MTTDTKLLAKLLLATKDGDWGSDEPAPEHSSIYVIRGADFPAARECRVDRVPLRYLPDKTVHRRILQANDILLETAGGTRDRPTGRTLLVTQNLLDQFDRPVTCASFARFLRADPALVDPGYLFWYLQAIYAQGETFQYQVQHTGVARFQYTAFAQSKCVPLPRLLQQQGIAEVLGAFDDKIAANIAIIATADALAASLTRSALDMTQHVSLNEIALVTMGSSPPGTSYNEVGAGVVFYQGVRDFGTRYPANRVWTTAPVRMAKADDCLLSVRAPVGRLNLSGEDTCIGRGLASVRSRTATPMTLFHLLRDAPEAWAPYEAEGTIFGSINKTQLEALSLPIVPKGIADDLERQLGALEASIASCLDENIKLAAMRDALLPQLMSGKIRVKDVEQMVGDVV